MKANIFFKICSGFAMVVVAVALLIFSVKYAPAKADTPNTINTAGKIMMHQNSFVHNGTFYFHVIAWDSETGKSKIYAFSQNSSSFKSTPYQLPSSPLY